MNNLFKPMILSFLQEDPTLEKNFKGHRDAVTCVDFNPNMKQLGMYLVYHFTHVITIDGINKAFVETLCF